MARGPSIRVVSAEIQRDGRYLLTQRMQGAVLPDLWEFPGGRVREGETDEQALMRSVADRVGAQVLSADNVLEVTHHYETYTVVLAVYRCELDGSEPFPKRVQAVAWVSPEEFGNYPFPGADGKTVEQLIASS
jgi:8-oxo-dGTP diphosphatase